MMNKEKFVKKHAEKFKEMDYGKSVGFETKKYKVFIDYKTKAFCENCYLWGKCIEAPCGKGVVKITKKEKGEE